MGLSLQRLTGGDNWTYSIRITGPCGKVECVGHIDFAIWTSCYVDPGFNSLTSVLDIRESCWTWLDCDFCIVSEL